MSNSYDTLDDLAVGDRDEPSAGGTGGAAIAVLLTLLLGLGLVFAAYKLGQRTGVDDPPLLTSEGGPIKVLPADVGGESIPNIDSASNAMIDQRAPSGGGYAVQDGILVPRGLPARDIEVATSIDVGEFRREEIDLAAIPLATSISGEPVLTDDSAPDRSLERLRAEGTEVIVPVEGGTPSLPGTGEARLPGASGTIETARLDPPGTAAQIGDALSRGANAAGESAAAIGAAASAALRGDGSAADGSGGQSASGLVTVTDTAVQPGGTQVAALMPMPRVKPPLSQRPVRPQAPPRPAAAPATVRPAARSDASSSLPVTVAPATLGVANAAPTPATAVAPRRPAAVIPAQPPGDAQVQLGAEGSPEEVRRKWNALRSAHPDLLGRLGLQVLPVSVNGGQLFRLRVGPLPDGPSAAQLCDQLQYRGVPCFVPERS